MTLKVQLVPFVQPSLYGRWEALLDHTDILSHLELLEGLHSLCEVGMTE